MRHMLKSLAVKASRVAIIMAPWLLAMYGFYWLDASGTWTSETPHRGKISVLILAAGMASSFLTWSYFAKRDAK